MLDDQKKPDSVPATSEECRAQLKDIKDSVKNLTKTLTAHADNRAKELQKFKHHLTKTGDTIIGETQKNTCRNERSALWLRFHEETSMNWEGNNLESCLTLAQEVV